MKTLTGNFALWLLASIFLAVNVTASVFYVDVNSTNPTPPYADWSTASTDIQSAVDASSDGDQIWVNDGIYQTGGRVVYGSLTNRVVINKAVTVQSVNGPAVTMIQGYQMPGVTNGDSAVRCVYLTNNVTLLGFTLSGGATRKMVSPELTETREQSGGGIWCENTTAVISNCIIRNNACYGKGGGIFAGTSYNCLITNNINFMSSTDGGGGVALGVLNNCMVIGNYAVTGGGAFSNILNNCTIANNNGVGVWGSVLTNCLLSGNAGTGTIGGGAIFSRLVNCVITNNSSIVATSGSGAYSSSLIGCLVAYNTGAGAESCAMTNCTIINNVGGGAVSGGTFENCIIYFNNSNNYGGGTFNHCCTTPLPTGVGNFTNPPIFVNVTNNFRLQTNSPCINAGINHATMLTNDLDGNPRIVGGTVDVGAYEYQTPTSILSYAWAQQYHLPTDGSADYADSDGDGLNNWQEWKAGTIPTNAASVLKLSSPSNSVSGVIIKWQSVANVTYFLQSSTNLTAFTYIQSNLVGQAGTTSYTDTTATNGGPYFYRVGVQ